ncbi:unnamed protein product, partial [marine sediment metagenome]
DIVSSVTVPPGDGIILKSKISYYSDAVYINGSRSKIFNDQGQQIRSGFFSTNSKYAKNTQIVQADINNDGKLETVVADETRVSVYGYDDVLAFSFHPYGIHFNKGINLAVGDMNRDGIMEIVTGTMLGGGPQVMIYNNQGQQIWPGFFCIWRKFSRRCAGSYS